MPKTEAQKRATEKYNAKTYDTITIRLPKGDKAKLKEKAEAAGKSLAKYIKDCCLD